MVRFRCNFFLTAALQSTVCCLVGGLIFSVLFRISLYSSIYCSQLFLSQFLYDQLILALRGCSTEVQLPGITTTVVLQHSSIDLTSSVRCVLKLSRTSSDSYFFVYTIRIFNIHCFITSSSIHAFFWCIITTTPLIMDRPGHFHFKNYHEQKHSSSCNTGQNSSDVLLFRFSSTDQY